MKLCISLSPSTTEEAIEKIQYASQYNSLIELRIDGMKEINLPRIFEQTQQKIIITNRTAREGGKFSGTLDEYEQLFFEAIECGAAYIDIEFAFGKNFFQKINSRKKKTKIILSHHNVQKTPASLLSTYNTMKLFGADVMKIVSLANSIADNKIIFDILHTARLERQKLISFCMGECGHVSRILAGKYGSHLLFAPLNEKEITAPGQLPFTKLYEVFRADKINKTTKVFGLIGNPVSQSKGIYFHNEIFSRKKMNAVYVNFLVHDLDLFFNSYSEEFMGASVTMPFKEKIIPYLDTVDDVCLNIGSVNTILRKKNKFFGYNTDYTAIYSLLRSRTSLKGKKIIVLGTGGVAKTMAHIGVSNNAALTILGRNIIEEAEQLSSELHCRFDALDNIHNYQSDIIMNGTSVGMETNEVKNILPNNFLKKNMVVVEAVYSPELTPLVIAAKEKGCKVITGKEIFEMQAKLQSQLFLEIL